MITKHLRSIPTAIPGVTQIKRFLFTDTRGSFTRLSDLENLRRLGWQGEVMQINHSVTKKAGTVRGMHYQNPPYTEYKLVNCIKGSVYDVVVDLREGSSTFLRSVAVKLSPDNSTALLIPPGCAHGFQSLEDDSELLYAHSMPFIASSDGGMNPLDPAFGIQWPLPIANMSEKDKNRPMITSKFKGIPIK